MEFVKRRVLWVALIVQALVLGWRLDLLPQWNDELYTLRLATQGPAQIIEGTRAGVHPPLYFLISHAWLRLPIPGAPLVRLRALSVLLTLLATLAFHELWLKKVRQERRLLFLGLWVFSPFLTMYARMARSYALQLLLVVLAVRLGYRWLAAPGDHRAMAAYVAVLTALLYTHYLPGLAVAGAIAMVGLWRRHWQQFPALAAMGVAYLPWMAGLSGAVGVVTRSRPYFAAPNIVLEGLLRLAYAFTGFNFGESIPLWGMGTGAILLPFIFQALWQAWRSSAKPPIVFVLIGLFGFCIAFSRVSFPFTGARLLFLLPFYHLFLLRGLDSGRISGLCSYTGLLVISCGGLVNYFQAENFLNKGYLVDFQQIARLVMEKSGGQRALVLLDPYSESAGYYLHDPASLYPTVILNDCEAVERMAATLKQSRPSLVWLIRSTRDSAREAGYREMQDRLTESYAIQRHVFVPYSRLDRLGMLLLGWKDRPTHVVEALEMRSPTVLNARAARNRIDLGRWTNHYKINPRWQDLSSPMTYLVDGKQFIALAVVSKIMSFGLP